MMCSLSGTLHSSPAGDHSRRDDRQGNDHPEILKRLVKCLAKPNLVLRSSDFPRMRFKCRLVVAHRNSTSLAGHSGARFSGDEVCIACYQHGLRIKRVMALFYPPCSVATPRMASLVPIHGLVHLRERRRLDILQNSVCETKFFDKNWSPLGWISASRKESYHMCCNRVESAANKQAPYSFQNNDPDSEPFWSSLTKEAYWCLRSLVVFLVAQPGQLKYIEWPSFKSTLKTATLTLVLVALLIVALSSVDAALWYLLALILRRSA